MENRSPDHHVPPSRSPGLPLAVKLWLGVDLFLALFPPLHWWARGTLAGAPRALIYLLGTSAVIATSAVVIFVADRARNEDGR